MFLQDAEWTPLFTASYKNHTDVMELLIQCGAQLDIINNVSLTYYNFHTSVRYSIVISKRQYCACDYFLVVVHRQV